jgi:acyl carrier protein
LSVILAVETKLGISLDSRDFEKVVTVGDLLNVIEHKLPPAAERRVA